MKQIGTIFDFEKLKSREWESRESDKITFLRRLGEDLQRGDMVILEGNISHFLSVKNRYSIISANLSKPTLGEIDFISWHIHCYDDDLKKFLENYEVLKEE